MSITATTKLIDNSKTSEASFNLIIHGGNNQICVDSRDIAREFGRQNKNVLQTLDELLEEGIISRLECKPRFYTKLGREYRCFELNKAGFLKVMPFIGGRKSREGQRCFVDEFLRMEVALERQSKERETLAYQVACSSGKDSRGILTDEIQKFVAYAKVLGSRNADWYFPGITNRLTPEQCEAILKAQQTNGSQMKPLKKQATHPKKPGLQPKPDVELAARYYSIETYTQAMFGIVFPDKRAKRPGISLAAIAWRNTVAIEKTPHAVWGEVDSYSKTMLDKFFGINNIETTTKERQ